MRENMTLRSNLSAKYVKEDEIKNLLHPKKRSIFSMLKRAYIPIRKDKKLFASHFIYAFAGGLIPLLSGLIISSIISILQDLEKIKVDNIYGAIPLIRAVGIYSLAILILSAITIKLELNKFDKFMKIRMDTLNLVSEKLAKIEYGFWENAAFADNIGNFINSLESNNLGLEGIYNELFEKSKSIVAFILISVLLYKINIVIPILAFITIILIIICQSAYSKYHFKLVPEINEVSRKMGYLNRQATDFNYGKDIRIFNARKSFEKLHSKYMKNFESLHLKLRKRRRLNYFPQALTFGGLTVSIIYALASYFQKGNLSLNLYIMTLSFIGIYISQIMEIAKLIFFVTEQAVDLEYLFDFLDADIEISGGEELDIENINGEIVFENVSFKYPGSDSYVLENLNLTIKAGESIALVGVNGAGKTTLVNLISGLFQPTQGKIYIGGIDISTISQRTLNKLMCLVLQEFTPIALTVKENIASSTDDIDEELVKESLEKLGLLEKINTFDKGIETMMLRVIDDEGMVLSGGENQKISIAKALYKNQAKILILDEPTSALDAFAEEEVYKEFQSLIKGKTGIFISHRLASTRFCDKILLLDGGKISQIGSHESLINEEGLYKEMFITQASYYKDGDNYEEI